MPRGLINVYEMPARQRISNAQNSLIVGMETSGDFKMTQIGFIGRQMLMQVLVSLKMVLSMGSILKQSTLLQNLMCPLDMYIHHFGDSRYMNIFHFHFPIITVFIIFKLIMSVFIRN